MHDSIRVESPFPEYAIPRVWTWIQEFRSRLADDFAPRTLEEFVAHWEQAGEKTWAVYRGDELGGVVSFEQWRPATGTAHCIFKRSFWGWQTTLPALEQVAREIFSGETHKLVFLIFEDNHAIKSLLKRIGAVQEGTVREATRRDGKYVDVILMGLTKEGFENGCAVRQQAEADQHVVADVHADVQSGGPGAQQ